MGVLIAVLATVMIGELIRRAFIMPDGDQIPAPTAVLASDLPADTRFVGVVATRSHIAVHVVLPDGRHRLYIVDPASGHVTGIMDPASPTSLLTE